MENRTAAIVLSAGKGTRMKTEVCKQYISVKGYPVLYYALNAFEKSNVNEIVIVAGKDDIEYVRKEIVEKYKFTKIKHIVAGGKERYDSVINGIDKISGCENVLVHDGARPLIKVEDINRIISEIENGVSCIAAVPAKDTIKISDENGFVKETPIRSNVWQVQTPQAFKTEILKNAYEKMRAMNDSSITDDAMVIEKYTDQNVKLIKTDYTNIKITTPEDLIFMEQCLDNEK